MPDRPFRIVVASPGDVQAERDLVKAVTDELNRSVAADRGVRLEVIRWETHAYPILDAGGPQAPVDKVLAIPEADLVVGIFWKRFGTPTPKHASGTEHEIRAAYEAFEKNERPEIMLYFKQKAHNPTSDELEQWSMVKAFQQEFDKKGMIWGYESAADFERQLRQHLTDYLRQRFQPWKESAEASVSVVVLPFDVEGSEPGSEAFGPGMAAWITRSLEGVRNLKILRPESLTALVNKKRAPDEIGRKLGAQYVVDGSLRKGDGALQVSSHVVRTGDDAPVSEEQASSSWTDVFALKTQIAKQVSEKVLQETSAQLTEQDEMALCEPPASSLSAAEEYEKGCEYRRLYNNGRDVGDFRAAELHLRKAVRLDPVYADALAELGFLFLVRWETEGGSQVLLDRSEDYFRWATAVDPQHPVARSELGFIGFVQGRREEGLEAATRSAAANPDRLISQNVAALLWLYAGFYESAIWHTRNRVQILDPYYVYPYTNAATSNRLLKRYDEAVRLARKAQAKAHEIDAPAFTPLLIEGEAHFLSGNLEEAKARWNEGLDMAPDEVDPIFEVALGWIQVKRGEKKAARQVMDRNLKADWLGGAYDTFLITLCAMLGELESALDLLERQRTFASSYRFLISDGTLGNLYGEKRFQRMLREHHEEWSKLRKRWLELLPDRPPRLQNPDDFLERAGIPVHPWESGSARVAG